MTVPRFVQLRIIMSTLLLSILGLAVGVQVQYCPVWREITPCTCKMENNNKVSIVCEKMDSFAEVVALLQNKFQPHDRIILKISYSNLDDLSHRSFKELNMTIEDLKLHHDNLSDLTPYPFSGLTHVSYLSIADNPITMLPMQVFEMMPNIKTLDIGRMRLKSLPEESFRSLPYLETLILPANMLHRIDTNAIPPTVIKLHLARDSIRSLNGTLRHLKELQWLFVNGNDLTTLNDELPKNSLKIRMLHAANNRIEHLPQDIKTFPNLDKLFFQYNMLQGLDGVLSKSRKLDKANFEHNRISILLEDEFAETERLEALELQYNLITTLNNSLVPLKNLQNLNLSHNLLTEFSWQEIRGLKELLRLDLSYNKINHLTGLMPNLVEWETKLTYLRLDNNELHSLNGALSGLRSLLRLNLSYNRLSRLSPDDLIGLDQLNLLDVSHNQITTLEETSKTFLPALEELIASHNYLTVLDKDFHGLPVLCWADLSNNQIVALGRDLVSKTHCRIHDGVHGDVWGTLKIYLKDNPILCDAAMEELTSAMEANHTRIVGSGYCPPLSEQPVTSKPSAFLGYLPESSTPLSLLSDPIYKPLIENSQPNNLPQSHQDINLARQQLLRGPYQNYQNNEPLHLRLNTQGHIPATDGQPIIPNDPLFKRSSNLQQQNMNILPADHAVINLSPISENQQLAQNEPFKRDSPNHVMAELPMMDQPLYTHIDPIIQEQQISQLASEIEQLRSRVQELTSENHRLAQNLNQILPNPGDNMHHDIYENSRPILPLEQITILSTEKPPNEDYDQLSTA